MMRVFQFLIQLFAFALLIFTIDSDGTSIETSNGKNCTRAGFICEDCLTSYNCFQLPNGTWIKELVENCSDTQTCLGTTGLCTSEPNADCETGFVCTQQGVFPDPTDCNKYHVCAGMNGMIEDHPEDCGEGFSYDTLTTLCSRPRTANCTRPSCANSNSTGGIEGNPRLYYQCNAGSTPRLYYCPPGKKYIKDRCHDEDSPYGVVDGKCVATGWFYVPDCKYNNRCSSLGSMPTLNNCFINSYFDYNINVCTTNRCTSLYL